MSAHDSADDVTFLRRARPGLSDLWVEFVDWAPTIATGTGVLMLPYLILKFLQPGKPHYLAGLARWAEWLWSDRAVRWSVEGAAAVCLALWVYKVAEILHDRWRHVVRIDLHEIECWPGGKLRFIPIRDVIGAHAGRRDTSSRWWILRAPRRGFWLFVRNETDLAVERVPFDWSRHEFLGMGMPVGADGDGNRAAADLIALLRQRRATLGLPLTELPEEAVHFESEYGLIVDGDRDQIVMKLPGRTVTVPGWAIRSAVVTAVPTSASRRAPLQLALDLDPRCGEFHLIVPIGNSQSDRAIVDWCQVLAARFDKDAVELALRR
jgi:hypothetical protein